MQADRRRCCRRRKILGRHEVELVRRVAQEELRGRLDALPAALQRRAAVMAREPRMNTISQDDATFSIHATRFFFVITETRRSCMFSRYSIGNISLRVRCADFQFLQWSKRKKTHPMLSNIITPSSSAASSAPPPPPPDLSCQDVG